MPPDMHARSAVQSQSGPVDEVVFAQERNTPKSPQSRIVNGGAMFWSNFYEVSAGLGRLVVSCSLAHQAAAAAAAVVVVVLL